MASPSCRLHRATRKPAHSCAHLLPFLPLFPGCAAASAAPQAPMMRETVTAGARLATALRTSQVVVAGTAAAAGGMQCSLSARIDGQTLKGALIGFTYGGPDSTELGAERAEPFAFPSGFKQRWKSAADKYMSYWKLQHHVVEGRGLQSAARRVVSMQPGPASAGSASRRRCQRHCDSFRQRNDRGRKAVDLPLPQQAFAPSAEL